MQFNFFNINPNIRITLEFNKIKNNTWLIEVFSKKLKSVVLANNRKF